MLIPTLEPERLVLKAPGELGWSIVQTYLKDDKNAARARARARARVLRLGGSKADRRRFPDGLERDVVYLPKQRETSWRLHHLLDQADRCANRAPMLS